ncbi:MAG: hypothetical protein D6816_12710 [Bacteroidetes bacterium]|nr:MAG: hypothetical protein D6816_12710 [Bacteroidota bacterium]
MLYVVGSRVRLSKTGDTGVVIERLLNGMVKVRLDEDGFEIPVFEDDLARDDSVAGNVVKAKVIQKPETDQPGLPKENTAKTQYAILKPTGLLLAFVPNQNAEGQVTSYDLHLINDTSYEAVASFGIYFNEDRPIKWDGKVPGPSEVKIGNMSFDALNQSPEVELTQKWITTEGDTESKTFSLRIKPKSFFKHVRMAPLLNVNAHLFKLVDKPDFDQKKQEEDLSEYTLQHARPGWSYNEELHEWVEVVDSKKLAGFQHAIDLHIEKLRPGAGKMSNSEILRIQLSAFEKYMEEAISLGVERVFIIHGVGKGKLRDEIATRLFQMAEVKSFKNEYHPKYGWGATEVIF